jgi:DNA-directed RNA polymerase specialized sigma24 family protein
MKEKPVSEIPKHRILREFYRNYPKFKRLFETDGTDVIEHSYTFVDENGKEKKDTISMSLWDLQGGLKNLSTRKREAVFYNVILDKKQKDVAEIMGITTVSVGQYVEQAMMQLAEDYFVEDLANVVE